MKRAFRFALSLLPTTWAAVALAAIHGGCTGTVLTRDAQDSGRRAEADAPMTCASFGDCDIGQACDPGTHVCTYACAPTETCHGGCCRAGTCIIGRPHADGTCGCGSASDCPVGYACNTASQACTTACSSSQLCHGGCCNAGRCSLGADSLFCGATGAACFSCPEACSGGAGSGTACLSNGTCGCNSATDCSLGEACDQASHACTRSCSSTQPCNGGCCNAGTGTCSAGAPLSGTLQCVCSHSSDCPEHLACDTATGACTTACSSTQTCRGACCSASSGGTCVAGTSAGACGASAVCTDCTSICPPGKSCKCVSNACSPGLTFEYTGGPQTVVVPSGVTQVTVEADGAQGGKGSGTKSAGGLGGTITATIPVSPGETLTIFVGGRSPLSTPDGGPGVGGFNGGGASGGTGLGGGASDVRRGGSDLAHRAVVAGGGGGGGAGSKTHGGAGGDSTGGSGGGSGGGGGTKSAGGAGGVALVGGCLGHKAAGIAGQAGAEGDGGSGARFGGGGGGGYYGGGGGGGGPSCVSSPSGSGGGGGSSYVEPIATGVSMSAGLWAGNGRVVITW